ncbi:hypothetical protein GN956_G13345 [Arapaima gigas]
MSCVARGPHGRLDPQDRRQLPFLRQLFSTSWTVGIKRQHDWGEMKAGGWALKTLTPLSVIPSLGNPVPEFSSLAHFIEKKRRRSFWLR